MTNKPGPIEPTPSDVAGERIRELRRSHGQSVADLAAACAAAGHPELTRDAIYAIESGRRLGGRRRRTVSVDELLAFAQTFGVPVAELLPAGAVPLEETRRHVERMLFEVLPALEQYKAELLATRNEEG